jgi:hypothetical protein
MGLSAKFGSAPCLLFTHRANGRLLFLRLLMKKQTEVIRLLTDLTDLPIYGLPYFIRAIFKVHLLCWYQRWGIVRSAKRCRHCIVDFLYSDYLRLESQNSTPNPCSPTAVDCILFTVLNSGTSATNWQNNPAQNTTTTSLFLSNNTSSLVDIYQYYRVDSSKLMGGHLRGIAQYEQGA